ncbi:redoxin domain-containing protein [Sulfurovum sp. bin170]|uniref:redoxin domain-containing protein n=1 Tax=Sulfurovum sp. bin170 TaxID=2695268 RepID=UPI0013E04FA8|nr:redoxin domain-containing protein [Sulfurovum sp. bin170]NEW60296.1 redoxin domain-containing protein [Sulfurovum sp. bin170]
MKIWSIKKIIKEVVITLLMLFVVSMALNYLRKPDTDTVLPDIKALSISGDEIAFVGDGTKPTVIHFWATWCPTCKIEAPNLESIKGEVHLVSVAVNSGTDSELRAFMEERGYTYAVVNDKEGKLREKFDVGAFPTTFIYDANGTLQFSEVGYSTTLGLKARLSLIR